MKIAIVCLIFIAFQCVKTAYKDSPVIGIILKPLENESHNIETNMTQVIDAFYIHYLSASGAQVVPISFKLTEGEYVSLLSKINGIFISGGSADFVMYDEIKKQYVWTPFSKGLKTIVKIAMQMNDKGIYFPIWGTCMGFQLLTFLASENPLLPKPGCNCSNYNAELNFTVDGENSRMFSGFSKTQMNEFRTQGLTFNSHSYYVDAKDFADNKNLRDMYKILAYSMDQTKTLQFVSAMEGRKYPFFGAQFHPEVRQYNIEVRIPGDKNLNLAQAFGNFFVNECRKNSNSMSASEEIALSIYNTPVRFDTKGKFIYLFP